MYREKLYEKLKEEVNEFLESEAPEEIADILEVLYAIMELNSLSKNEIEIIRTDKADKRGSFNKRLILHSVTNHHED
jgi:predicted house-cleaning noncanonical NTP pyrophosphatase (MazG superfamily)